MFEIRLPPDLNCIITADVPSRLFCDEKRKTEEQCLPRKLHLFNIAPMRAIHISVLLYHETNWSLSSDHQVRKCSYSDKVKFTFSKDQISTYSNARDAGYHWLPMR